MISPRTLVHVLSALRQTGKGGSSQRSFGSTLLWARCLRNDERLSLQQRSFGSTTALARWQRDEEHLQQLARERENIEKMEADELRRLREEKDSIVWLPPHAGNQQTRLHWQLV